MRKAQLVGSVWLRCPQALLVVVALLGTLGLPLLATGAESPDAADAFRQSVAPVLERHCVGCHQGAKAKGGLALTDLPALLKGGESGPAIVPGKPDESLLLDYISGDAPEMPKDAAPLAAADVAALRGWIATGAVWPEGLTLTDKKVIDGRWWSLEPLTRPAVPEAAAHWGRTPIDAFILARLQAAELEPSPEADRRTLIRRLAFDLHGLPPTPEETAAYIDDAAPDAYERLVERLLASPRYGERWGRHWLDVVHFGETHGYDKDKVRPNAWPYRDYVIRAFNDDKPYDRFIAEQLAGDVLYPQDPQATVATAFIAAGPWDLVGHIELREGTVDKDIARSNDRDDMVAATMSTFASLTVHCARCHNHKFDPIRQQEYYQLQAVFAGVERGDRPFDADLARAHERADLAQKKQALEAERAPLLAAEKAAITPEIAALDQQIQAAKTELASLDKTPAGASQSLGYHSQIMPGQNVTKWVQVDLGKPTAIDEIVLVPAHVAYGGHPGPGFGFPPRFKVEVSDQADFANAQSLDDQTAADLAHPGDKPHRISAVGHSARYVRVTATRLWKRTDDWIFALAELQVFAANRNVALGAAVSALDSIEAAPSWGQRYLVDGASSLAMLEDANAQVAERRQRLQSGLQSITEQRHALMTARVPAELRSQLDDSAARLADVEARLAALPTPQMVYAIARDAKSPPGPSGDRAPRPIHLLARGDVRTPLDLVEPGTVACVRGPDAKLHVEHLESESERRAALAAWLVDPRNALVRRSIVNRVWQYHFGQGLVDTPNDFGRMGSQPSHPELLEWLAGWFLDSGQSLKGLHRLILTSAVYRQTSRDNPAGMKADAGNRLLWRMNRARLDAESIHDAILAVSGQLDLTMGGPSVQQFFFKDDHSPVYDYERVADDDPRLRRRSVYRFIVRSVPDPLMDSLDCADPSILTPKRNITITSIQALAMLNDRFVVRQAEHLAERAAQATLAPADQIDLVYRLALGRGASEHERQLLAAHAARHGLASACRLVLNSNEFLFVD